MSTQYFLTAQNNSLTQESHTLSLVFPSIISGKWIIPDIFPSWSGHSERRTLFHETSEVVATKTRAALDAGLKIILCIGETLDQRESGKTAEVCEAQLKAVVDVTKEADWK